MNATKRKFNAIIQGIGNRPSSPASNASKDESPTPRGSIPSAPSTPGSMSADADLLSKRRRVGIPGSTLETKGPTSISNVVLRKWNSTKKQPEAQPQPRARKLGAQAGPDEKLVDKYAELIVEAHQEDCLWKKRGCEDSLLRISFSNATANLESLRARYDELCARKPFLPYEFNLKLPEEIDVDALLSQLPTDFFSNPPPPKDTSDPASPNRAALVLAHMGWQGLSDPRIGAVPNSASCHSCLRRLGLWMFKSKEVGPDNEVIVPAPMDHLDPIKEHRFFCPWKNAHTQQLSSSRSNADRDFPAWKLLSQSLRNEAYLRG
ncbi:unnamed protein product [Parascedosporium putredinis]|uniref:Uncharacterized protein n=1 Tax=Parascedosporium putredinis TaxID=1442378 RepID=A0A9P1HE59_9PEZI|nr:unnamed protein product [Parascedosporium putredinis]CAI8004714.1 unnamed protein product [Parascedosporium putredinis]